MPSLAARAASIARHRLDEDPHGLRVAEWTVEAIEMVLAAEAVEVDPDLTIAVVWASASIGSTFWSDHGGQGYQVEDVRHDLGGQVARLASWCVPEDWQSDEEHLDELLADGPMEARLVVLARTMVLSVSRRDLSVAELAERVMALAMSIPALVERATLSFVPRVHAEA